MLELISNYKITKLPVSVGQHLLHLLVIHKVRVALGLFTVAVHAGVRAVDTVHCAGRAPIRGGARAELGHRGRIRWRGPVERLDAGLLVRVGLVGARELGESDGLLRVQVADDGASRRPVI